MMALHQEHSLYDDQSPRGRYGKDSSMYLDLKKGHHLLHTPDVSVFALSTPEIHNLLSSSINTTAHTTCSTTSARTPASLPRTHPVTMEQEYYAQGFLDRLEALQAGELHNKNVAERSMATAVHRSSSSAEYATGPNPSLEMVAPTYVTATLDRIPNFATTQTIPESTSSYPVNSTQESYYSDSYTMPFRHDTAAFIPTGYPAMIAGSLAGAQPMYESHVTSGGLKEMTMVPDMQTQEHMKVERKKARNRIAASKCRVRRLQRESDLETKVKYLKDHNRELNDEVNGLRDQINNLKRALVQHMKTGCHVNVPESFEVPSMEGTDESSQ